MTKRLIDTDDEALSAAQAELGTATIKDTVNDALRRVVGDRPVRISLALDVLAEVAFLDRSEAWR